MTGVYPFVHGVRKNGTNRLAAENVTLAERLQQAGMHTQAIVASFVLNRMFGIDQGFDEYADVSRDRSAIALHEERDGREVCDDALLALRKLDDDRFFMWVHFYDPHYPYLASQEDSDSPQKAYADEVTFVDRQIGRLLESLRRLDLERRTLVVLVGDHGEAFSEHDEYQHGYFVYDTTLHVPLIFRCPGTIPADRNVEAVVRTVDIAPTVLDLLDLPPLDLVQGVSLRPLLDDSAADPEFDAYAESLEAHVQFGLSPLRSLRSGSWKYVLAPEAQLFDLGNDASENVNVLADHPEVAAEMRTRLKSLVANAPPPPNQSQATIALDQADLSRLEALGYLATTTEFDSDDTELSRFEPRGDDPKHHTEAITLYSQSHWALMEGQFGMGEHLLRKLVLHMPDSPRVRADLAYVLLRQGVTTEAEEHYLKAIEIDPQDGYLRRMYGGLLMRTKRWAEATDHLTIAVTERPDDLEAWYNLGIAVAFQGRYAESRRHLTRALEIDPRHVSSLHAMGAAFVQEGKLSDAADCFRRVLEIDPNHARSRNDLQRAEAGLQQSP